MFTGASATGISDPTASVISLVISHQVPLVVLSPKWYFLGQGSRCPTTGRIRTQVLEEVMGQQANIAEQGSVLLKRAVHHNTYVPRASCVCVAQDQVIPGMHGSHFTMSSAGQFLRGALRGGCPR